jgi:hypothetical protein
MIKEFDLLHDQISPEGLKRQVMSGREPGEINKGDLYNAMRVRFVTLLKGFSDEQIEQGIEELEEKFQGQDILYFDVPMKGLILTKI